MGEARRRVSATKRFLAEHPYCCFCGGQVRAETRDHLPPKCFFDNKHIPNDMIVPACRACNEGSRASDQIAAFASRIGFGPQSTVERREFRRLGRAISRNFPDVSREWFAANWRDRQKVRFFAAKHRINCGEPPGVITFGPKNCGSLNLFAHKFTLGLFYHQTGQVLPPKGGYIAFIQPKEVIAEFGLPKLILDALGPIDTLKQGQFRLFDQFKYRWDWNADEGVFGHVSLFREAYAVVGFAVLSLDIFQDDEDKAGYLRPDELFSIPSKPEYMKIIPEFGAMAA